MQTRNYAIRGGYLVMRILLIATNRMRVIMPPMPLGLINIASCLDKEYYKVKILDLMFSKSPIKEIIDTINDCSPEIIGLSIRNVDNQTYIGTEYAMPWVKKVVETCRNLY